MTAIVSFLGIKPIFQQRRGGAAGLSRSLHRCIVVLWLRDAMYMSKIPIFCFQLAILNLSVQISFKKILKSIPSYHHQSLVLIQFCYAEESWSLAAVTAGLH